jgi:hypothetical protein
MLARLLESLWWSAVDLVVACFLRAERHALCLGLPLEEDGQQVSLGLANDAEQGPAGAGYSELKHFHTGAFVVAWERSRARGDREEFG